jgi:hypothetical protein
LLFYATSWRFPRSSQERNPGVPPGNSLGIRRLLLSRLAFYIGKSRAKFLAVPFRLKFVRTKSASQVSNAFAAACGVLLPCWRFIIKTPTQNLKVLIFAKR